MSNKKIRNATTIEYDNIKFKSILEKNIYSYLKEHNYNPKYEPITFELYQGFIPITPFYDKETDNQKLKRIKESDNKSIVRLLNLKSKKITGIHYTPDFYFKYKDLDVYIEAKGMENDVFYIKKKMFIKYLDDFYIKTKQKSIYFEIYNKKQLIQSLNIIKEYAES